MEREQLLELLGLHEVKPTANRILVAEALMSAGRPMSLTELERVDPTLDKSSIFRALTVFRERHLVHVIEDGGEAVRYELCLSHAANDDDDLHVHFFCERCHRTFCLHGTAVPPVALPEGYEQISVNYMVKGICPECRTRHGRRCGQ